MLELKRCHYPDPWGRPSEGDLAALEAMGIAEIREHYRRLYQPRGAILGVAGRIEWEPLVELIGELFGRLAAPRHHGTEAGKPRTRMSNIFRTNRIKRRLPSPTTACPTGIPIIFRPRRRRRPERRDELAAVFGSARKARAMLHRVCFLPHASRSRLRTLLCRHDGPAAQETLDVTLEQLRLLEQGIEPGELARLKTRVKSSLVMQQESSSARSSALARDWYHLGRVRTLDEVERMVEELTCESINRYLAANPPRDFTIVTLGHAGDCKLPCRRSCELKKGTGSEPDCRS